jgi:hypothetical protein
MNIDYVEKDKLISQKDPKALINHFYFEGTFVKLLEQSKALPLTFASLQNCVVCCLSFSMTSQVIFRGDLLELVGRQYTHLSESSYSIVHQGFCNAIRKLRGVL